MSEYNYKGKIPVVDAYPEEDEDSKYFIREMSTLDIAEMRFNWFVLGWMTGALFAGIASAYYFMR